ncbi:ATP-binding protein [Streptomyces glomeratus]|uniref:ATP-binding protein n=1 Tax=Streptomyces glomeratus TaxID=284452 RepID=A0ABP6M062_9ACTN|nr:ATP-binding protein [Streptomyces glomeratus]MCF1512716.1 ATP-binding protein [Streptomyces glomeratus]
MKQAADGEGWALSDESISVSAAFEGTEAIAEARAYARSFLQDLQALHGVPVSGRAMGNVQLVVSELVTNAQKYAPGPYLLTLEADEGAVGVTVWDSEPRLPVIQGFDPVRVGQHGLEIVVALCRGFEVHREPVGKRIRAAVDLAGGPIADVADRAL